MLRSTITESDLSELRRALHVERAKRLEMIENLKEHGLGESMTASTGELSSYDQHPGDAGTEMEGREYDVGLRVGAEQVLGRIDEALGRMERGTYGLCVKCSRPIPLERLKALPYASMCVECAAEGESPGEDE